MPFSDPQLDLQQVAWRHFAVLPISVSTFAICAVTSAWAGTLLDRLVFAAVVVIVVTATLISGRLAGAYVALMGACSFDFFRVEPIRTLHLRALFPALVVLVLVATAVGTRLTPAGLTQR